MAIKSCVQWNGISSSRFIFLYTRKLGRMWIDKETTGIAYLVLCFACVMLIPYHAHSTNFFITILAHNKRLKNERNIQFVILFCACYICKVMAYFDPALSFQREQKHVCSLQRSFCVILLSAKNCKFCKIPRSACTNRWNLHYKEMQKFANFSMAY